MRQRPTSAATPSKPRRTLATARRPISKRWRTATSTAMWQPVGRGTRLMAGAAAGARRASTRVSGSKPQAELQPAAAPTRVEAMRAKLKAGGHASPYRLRNQFPEPVFGQIKQARGFRQFLLRGFDNIRAEWATVCTAHNLLKLAQRR